MFLRNARVKTERITSQPSSSSPDQILAGMV